MIRDARSKPNAPIRRLLDVFCWRGRHQRVLAANHATESAKMARLHKGLLPGQPRPGIGLTRQQETGVRHWHQVTGMV